MAIFLQHLINLVVFSSGAIAAFVHPGLLHTAADFKRIIAKVEAKNEPWYTDWTLLTLNKHAQTTYVADPQKIVYRGVDSAGDVENYQHLYNDVAAAYQLGIRWKISGDAAYAVTAVEIMNNWTSTITGINGSSDKYLASGIYGYQFANAAELLRDYSGWVDDDRIKTGVMLANVFGTMNEEFLVNHNGAGNAHYYANWDMCNIASLMAIGVFNDNATAFDFAVDYWLYGAGEGALSHYIFHNFTEADSTKILSQGQESGRDQGHATLDLALGGVLAQQAYNQGKDLFASYGNALLNSAEYTSKYNTGHYVPYTAYTSYEGIQSVISNSSRFAIRPGTELLYAHYDGIKGLNASWTGKYRDMVNANLTGGVEGGGGDYASTSGGYDALGFGTLLYRIS